MHEENQMRESLESNGFTKTLFPMLDLVSNIDFKKLFTLLLGSFLIELKFFKNLHQQWKFKKPKKIIQAILVIIF